jgi:hypothetical protein
MERNSNIHQKQVPLMVDRPTKENWPKDQLMTKMRLEMAASVSTFMNSNKALCDPMDLRQQVLFRLTTFSIDQLFEQNEILNSRKAEDTIAEQYSIIRQRLNKSELPLAELLKPEKFFGKEWHIEKQGNISSIVNHTRSERVALEVREIDLKYAKAVFRDLHYIHTERAELALGIFIHGRELPFSIIGLARVDRYYKHLALMAQGYNSANCWNVTRLYNRPDSPMNTSSTMFGKAVAYLKLHYPETEAIITAFTPSFATGKSMVAGGFNIPILSMPLKLTFGNPTGLGWERLTNQRMSHYNGEILSNRLPLLPIIHLMRPILKPKHVAPDKINKMLVLNDGSNISGFLRH